MLSEISQRQILYDITYMWNLNKYNKLMNTKIKLVNTKKKEADSQIKLVVNNGEEQRGGTGIGKWKVQTTGCKTGYKDALYNAGNIANIL